MLRLSTAGDKLELFGGLTVLRLGGHFPGSAVLHWDKGCEGRGILCTGAVSSVQPDLGQSFIPRLGNPCCNLCP